MWSNCRCFAIAVSYDLLILLLTISLSLLAPSSERKTHQLQRQTKNQVCHCLNSRTKWPRSPIASYPLRPRPINRIQLHSYRTSPQVGTIMSLHTRSNTSICSTHHSIGKIWFSSCRYHGRFRTAVQYAHQRSRSRLACYLPALLGGNERRSS